MATFVADRMDAPRNWTDLNERVGQIGAAWTYHSATPATRWYLYGGKVHCGVIGAAYASGVPASADYDVECDYTVYTDIGSVSIAGRMSTTALTFYYVYYGGGYLNLIKSVAGVLTNLGSEPMAWSGTKHLTLSMRGTALTVSVDGVETISATDGDIPGPGRAGVRAGGVNDKETGKHIDNFLATDLSVAARPTARVVGLVGI